MDPLQNLHDITLPAPVSNWPLAWGWWLLLVTLVLLLIAAVLLWRRRQARWAMAKLALAELASLDSNHRDYGQQVSSLLKRTLNAYGLRQQSAALHGSQWQQQLQQYHAADWQTLLGDPYAPTPTHGGGALQQAATKVIAAIARGKVTINHAKTEANHA
ncbi:DUF4381 domain-containing protein [Ferrimonas senticii]|uniref:DUF4381 domain-containing protein n=1 Tax=Ferrimonas senticii TaxID=394566 RepID=UPI0004046C9C|nr:DUF4381 domain-containing protein [Ferrimonas senticii]